MSSGGEYMRIVADAGDWIWGLIQGGFNEQQTVSQIIVDAVIGMIPVVGDITAVRDLLAVVIRLADDPSKREDPMQWVELVIGLLALIPVAGGAIKGVAKLLLRVGKEAAEHRQIVREAIELLNRLGVGDAVDYFGKLDLSIHTAALVREFQKLVNRLVEVIDAILRRTRWVLPGGMKRRLQDLRGALRELLGLGVRYIPDGVKELNNRLKAIQSQIYNGDWHEIPSSLRSSTREAEAGLTTARVLPAPSSLPHPPNTRADYVPEPGYPDLTDAKYVRGGVYEKIEAFSGPIRADTLPEGTKIYRILDVRYPNKYGNWWALELPPNGTAWRKDYAVLDSWSQNRLYVELTVPPGGLKVWRGKAASQVERNASEMTYGQVLEGGGEQLFIDFNFPDNAAAKAALDKVEPKMTGWLDTMGVGVPRALSRAVRLGDDERAEKTGSFEQVTRVPPAPVQQQPPP
ncbi:MAG TPA: hypothetical protein VIK91_25820 [Nannocystis sp.]